LPLLFVFRFLFDINQTLVNLVLHANAMHSLYLAFLIDKRVLSDIRLHFFVQQLELFVNLFVLALGNNADFRDSFALNGVVRVLYQLSVLLLNDGGGDRAVLKRGQQGSVAFDEDELIRDRVGVLLCGISFPDLRLTCR
jgi:hypothetical protein